MSTLKRGSITQAIQKYLTVQGEAGATMAQIYVAVELELGRPVRKESIRSVVYNRLMGVSRYEPKFERIENRRGSPIRLLVYTSQVSER